MSRPLRILSVVNLPWNIRLGASRVWIELAERWRASGHIVEKYCITDAFSEEEASGPRSIYSQVYFPLKVRKFIRQNAERFDVIDALLGTVPYPKEKLGFKGLLVARSVGFFLLYERFEAQIPERWPEVPRGKWLGQQFYSFARRQLYRNCRLALKHCDLVNLPNKDELNSLRADANSHKPAIIQPYGLPETTRHDLQQKALELTARLRLQRISFIGMWSIRKGSKDWAAILRHVPERCPGVTFRFLGTMTETEKVMKDLPDDALDYVEIVPQFDPEELPFYLSDCAVGAFPSYVEGFGFAVLEQLAAGIPVVAYDSPGPREMLVNDLPHLLVSAGNPAALSTRICEILESDLPKYEELAATARRIAEGFQWNTIAPATIDNYRTYIESKRDPMLLFVQPFGLAGAGGGPKIIRTLLTDAPIKWHSVCVSPDKTVLWRNETHLAVRPAWGRIERSRFAWLPNLTQPLFVARFKKNLRKLYQELGVTAVHVVPHAGLDFAYTYEVAKELGLPVFISIHDDVAYSAKEILTRRACRRAMREVWKNAEARFVISAELGEEYCRTFGKRPFAVVTDGLANIQKCRKNYSNGSLRIYFMGLFHLSYEPNLIAFVKGLVLLRKMHPDMEITLTCRCGMLREITLDRCDINIEVLPFASESEIEEDLGSANAVYLPLPFGKEFRRFVQFSLSTKMVTYLGSGIPIIYHGPRESVAYRLLAKPMAAVMLLTQDSSAIAREMDSFLSDPKTAAELVSHAGSLARKHFMLDQQRQTFWSAISKVISQ